MQVLDLLPRFPGHEAEQLRHRCPCCRRALPGGDGTPSTNVPASNGLQESARSCRRRRSRLRLGVVGLERLPYDVSDRSSRCEPFRTRVGVRVKDVREARRDGSRRPSGVATFVLATPVPKKQPSRVLRRSRRPGPPRSSRCSRFSMAQSGSIGGVVRGVPRTGSSSRSAAEMFAWVEGGRQSSSGVDTPLFET